MRESIALLLEWLADLVRDEPLLVSPDKLQNAAALELEKDFAATLSAGTKTQYTQPVSTDYVGLDGRAIHECPKPTATDVVNCILDRPIEWVDWKSLPHEARLRWSNDAKLVLENPAFISLCGKMIDQARKTNGELVKTLLESGFRYSETIEQMRDARMTMNGVELVRENLEKMLYAEQPTTQDDIHAAA